MDALKSLFKQPYWIIALVVGALLVAAPCLTIAKGQFDTHPPQANVLVAVGGVLLLVSAAGFAFSLWSGELARRETVTAGLDLSRVKEQNGVLSAKVGDCELRVTTGRVEKQSVDKRIAIVLPCNEYFDDRCAGDTNSALGAYVNNVFEGQAQAFVSLMSHECQARFGSGEERQKTREERSRSYGVGRCLLLLKPLGNPVPVALVSTSTQRADEGLNARISYLFDGMRDLAGRLADARIDDVVMPILGAGHGGIEAPLAFVGLILAIAEAALYAQGGRRLRRVTIVVFQRDSESLPVVDPVVVRRALALIPSRAA